MRAEVVDLGRLDLSDDVDEVGRVRQVAVMEYHLREWGINSQLRRRGKEEEEHKDTHIWSCEECKTLDERLGMVRELRCLLTVMWICVEVMQSTSIERGAPADDTIETTSKLDPRPSYKREHLRVHFVTFRQKELCQIGPSCQSGQICRITVVHKHNLTHLVP